MFNYNCNNSFCGFNYISFVTNTSTFSKGNLSNVINLNFMNLILFVVFILIFSLLFRFFSRNQFFNLIINLNFIQFFDFWNLIIPVVFLNFILLIYNILIIDYFSVYTTTVSLFFFILPVVIIPITYFFTFSTSTLLCIGLTKKNSIFGTLINDYITLVSFLLRFLSQYVRIILILIVFVLLFEYLNTSFNVYNNNIDYSCTNLSNLLVVFSRIVFELLDCFFIFFIQFNTFFIILLWLLSFLFILKFNNVFES